jgi:hypothetical protein
VSRLSIDETLKALVADARSRVSDPPTWGEVREDATRLRLGAAHADAAVIAGLMTDEVWMASVDHWPADINEPLRHLGLFEKYSPTTLHGVLQRLSSRQIGGLTNSVKGASLELHTVDGMNHGTIPMAPGASHAELIHPLNHPGTDIRELAGDGHTVAEVQVKATDQWHVIARHLDRYPQYPDVVTTHQGAQAMLQHGHDAHHVIDTGVQAHVLTDHVGSHMDALGWTHFSHELVPEIALAAIVALALVKLRQGAGVGETANWVKEQATIAGLANAAGLAVQVATGTVALRPVAAIATRFTAERGSVARRAGAALRRVRSVLEALRQSCEARGYAPWSLPVA